MTRVAGTATRRARRRWFDAAVVVAAILLPPVLAISALMLRYVGDAWWLTSVGLYLPRFMLATPLVVLAPVLLAQRRYKLLLAQVVSLWLLLFPLLGFVLPSWHGSDDRATLRLLSYNVNSAAAGPEAIARSIAEFNPDIVLLQELAGADMMQAELTKVYPNVQSSGQFMIASRLPIRSSTTPQGFSYEGESHTAHFIRHELETPLGALVVYNVHPVSPRKTIATVRGSKGFRRELLSGRFFEGGSAAINKRNSDLRELELASAADLARTETLPLVIAGDTNLPALSPVLARLFSGYKDGFREAGWGFGYTYPRRLPWMRIDRVFASGELEFTSFHVGCGKTSDHRCVSADIRRAR